jgi:hypothetical protein
MTSRSLLLSALGWTIGAFLYQYVRYLFVGHGDWAWSADRSFEVLAFAAYNAWRSRR